MSSRLALTYFDMPGRARVLRKAFGLSGVEFDDRAWPRDQIHALKPSLPYGMVPILSIPNANGDGEHVIAEAQAITRYIGRVTGMYPPASEPFAAAMVDEILDSLDDLNERLLIPTYQEDDADKKKAMRLHLVQGPLREALERIDARLGQIQRLAFFRDHAHWLFVHELLVWDYATKLRVDGLDHIPPTFVDQFHTIVAVVAKVEKTTSVSHQRVQHDALPVKVPKQLTLTSFASSSRADPVRLALHIAGVSFEDERISHETFVQRKPTLPNGQLPVLHVGDQLVAQSLTLLRYAGTIGGLYPPGDLIPAARMDEVLSHIGELYFFFDPIYQDTQPDRRQSIHQALADEVVPESLAAMEKRLVEWKTEDNRTSSPFAMGGESVTVVDLAIYGLVEFFTSDAVEYIPNTIAARYEHIMRAHAAVREHDRVRDWFSKAT